VLFHYHPDQQAQMVNFLKNLAMAGGLLYVAAFGAGSISVDGSRR
jgi:putative oxidoreductase